MKATKNTSKVENIHLDSHEQVTEQALSKEWLAQHSAGKETKAKRAKAAKESKKKKAISFRVSDEELEQFKQRAEANGRRYTTLLNMFIHKYNRGQLDFSEF